MINVLIGIFYIAVAALISYLLYYIIKIAIKDALNELDYKSSEEDETYVNASFDDGN